MTSQQRKNHDRRGNYLNCLCRAWLQAHEPETLTRLRELSKKRFPSVTGKANKEHERKKPFGYDYTKDLSELY